MPTRVFLLRHAESADPTVFHGFESDIELSEKGKRQAEGLVDVLLPRKPGVIVTSGMKRSQATALPLSRTLGVPLQIELDFHERKMGILTGVAFKTDTVWPETLKRWKAGELGYAHEGAESFKQIRDRVLPVWQRVTAQHQGKSVVMVLHGVVVKVLLLSLLQGYSAADWDRLGPSQNVAISELVQEADGWKPIVLNQFPDLLKERGLF